MSSWLLFFSIKRKITKLIELIRFIFHYVLLFTEICLDCSKDVHVLCALQSRTQLKVIQILNEYHISICYTLLRKSAGKVVSADDVVNDFEVFSVSNFCRVIYGICSNTFWRWLTWIMGPHTAWGLTLPKKRNSRSFHGPAKGRSCHKKGVENGVKEENVLHTCNVVVACWYGLISRVTLEGAWSWRQFQARN